MNKKRKQPQDKQYGIVDNGEEYIIFNRENGDHLKVGYNDIKDLVESLYSVIPGLRECYDFRRAMSLINQIRL